MLNNSFINSALMEKNHFQDLGSFLTWFESKKKNNHFFVKKISFSELDQWAFGKNKTNLYHASGKFFTIEGLAIKTNFGIVKKWEQPIINQPEIGILGIITKVINNTRYFLMQAKMEPGNINLLQLSPTVQATKSNFTQVHKGKLPDYLEYFMDKSKAEILIDQLQPEQGGRFYKKRNRNMVVEVKEDIDLLENFKWLTLHDIKTLFEIDNFVNMDSRSVLATINGLFFEHKDNDIKYQKSSIIINDSRFVGLKKDIILSMLASNKALLSLENLLSWLTGLKTHYEIDVKQKPLNEVKDWLIEKDRIINENHHYFSVIAVSVEAGTREVKKWTQPLISESKIGLIGFLTTKINGILHFLIQGKVEPGNMDIVDMAPTVSCSDIGALKKHKRKTPFLEYFLEANDHQIRYATIQSEEGGRFYHFQNKNMIIEIDNFDINNDIPKNYNWMALSQIIEFQRFGMLNIEARNLISYLNLL